MSRISQTFLLAALVLVTPKADVQAQSVTFPAAAREVSASLNLMLSRYGRIGEIDNDIARLRSLPNLGQQQCRLIAMLEGMRAGAEYNFLVACGEHNLANPRDRQLCMPSFRFELLTNNSCNMN